MGECVSFRNLVGKAFSGFGGWSKLGSSTHRSAATLFLTSDFQSVALAADNRRVWGSWHASGPRKVWPGASKTSDKEALRLIKNHVSHQLGSLSQSVESCEAQHQKWKSPFSAKPGNVSCAARAGKTPNSSCSNRVQNHALKTLV